MILHSQFNLALDEGNFAVYDKDYRNVWTPRKHTRDVIRWISSDNPAKIFQNYA